MVLIVFALVFILVNYVLLKCAHSLPASEKEYIFSPYHGRKTISPSQLELLRAKVNKKNSKF